MLIKVNCSDGEFIINTDNISAYHIDSNTLFVNSPLGTGDGILHPYEDGYYNLVDYFKKTGIEVNDE